MQRPYADCQRECADPIDVHTHLTWTSMAPVSCSHMVMHWNDFGYYDRMFEVPKKSLMFWGKHCVERTCPTLHPRSHPANEDHRETRLLPPAGHAPPKRAYPRSQRLEEKRWTVIKMQSNKLNNCKHVVGTASKLSLEFCKFLEREGRNLEKNA